MIVILGAGLSGLAASYHLGHENCMLLERNLHAFGHVASHQREGFSWDIGPHVSFTKNDYVKTLFESFVGGEFEDFEVKVGNYFKGHWIEHPAQTALHQVPQPYRDACLASFLETRARPGEALPTSASNYQEWLERAFGPEFASTFSEAYTQKYWTRPACEMTTEWIGERILYPAIDDVVRGAVGPLDRSMHYITRVRYPKNGGYQSFASGLRQGSLIRYGAEVKAIDLVQREVYLLDGSRVEFDCLVNTLPLPVFIGACKNVPSRVADAAQNLSCTQLMLVNVAAPHKSPRPEHWLYVYDDDKLSTRINFTEKLSQTNAPKGWTGVQAEVYFSRHRPLPATPQEVAARVEEELIEMGLIDPSRFPNGLKSHRHVHYAPWANVIFDHDTSPALETIWTWLETHGLQRESDDTHPLTNWSVPHAKQKAGARLFMAGRFAQWKYYWTDDCVLRGRRISEVI